MEDNEIIRLYLARDTDAIARTAEKYGGYCRAITGNILDSPEDAEECVNDTWLKVWNSIPPQPIHFSAFLGRIARNLALDRLRSQNAEKRGAGAFRLVLDELAECVSGGESAEQTVDRAELLAAINGFLAGLPRQKRDSFVLRYWYARPVADIAAAQGMSPGSVTMQLKRSREKLKAYLLERGFEV